jgi:hypothetical protein
VPRTGDVVKQRRRNPLRNSAMDARGPVLSANCDKRLRSRAVRRYRGDGGERSILSLSGPERVGVVRALPRAWHAHCLNAVQEASTAADIPSIMNALAPDLSQYWPPSSATAAGTADVLVRDDDAVAAALLDELAVLVERVNAARSVF